MAVGRRWIPFYVADIFLYELNAEKYLQENHFLKKIISLKIFYDKKHFTSKQTNH
jgi:hypothetical protein